MEQVHMLIRNELLASNQLAKFSSDGRTPPFYDAGMKRLVELKYNYRFEIFFYVCLFGHGFLF